MIEYPCLLPGNIEATFRYTPLGVEVEWSPAVPKARHWRRPKFKAAYERARRDFFELIADQVGGPVLVVNPDAEAAAELVQAIEPPRRH